MSPPQNLTMWLRFRFTLQNWMTTSLVFVTQSRYSALEVQIDMQLTEEWQQCAGIEVSEQMTVSDDGL